VRPQPAPRLAAAGAGAFPTLRRPRVLWIGLAPNPALDPLYESVERACDAAGLGRERRPWHPHVTLGRVRDGARIDAGALARAAEAVRPDVTFTVNTVDLMRSELAPAGARYTRLGACPLEGG
jgi:2'-5' RNA ligase